MNNLFRLVSIISFAAAGFGIKAMELSEGRFLKAIENQREGIGGDEILLYVTADTMRGGYHGPSFEYGPSGTTLVKFTSPVKHTLQKKIDLEPIGMASMLLVIDLLHNKIERFDSEDISNLPSGSIKLVINRKGEMTLSADK